MESPSGTRVFPFNLTTHGAHVNKTMEKVGSPERGAHIFRHTCAVWLIHYLEWERHRVREFCRWRRERSMASYNKRHLLVKNEGRLTEAQEQRGQWLWEDPRDRFGLPDPEERIWALSALGISGGIDEAFSSAYPDLSELS